MLNAGLSSPAARDRWRLTVPGFFCLQRGACSYRELRSAIGARDGAGDKRSHRRRVDDVSTFTVVRLDPRRERLHAVHNTTEIHTQNPIPVPVLMTPLAVTFPASQWRECRARPANAHGASFPQTDVGNLDAGLACPLQPRASDPVSRNEALQHSANFSTPVRPLGGVLAK
jgi:hypothetical protein